MVTDPRFTALYHRLRRIKRARESVIHYTRGQNPQAIDMLLRQINADLTMVGQLLGRVLPDDFPGPLLNVSAAAREMLYRPAG